MGSESITFRGETIHVHDTSLAIWLRLIAMHLEKESSSDSIIGIRNDWMSDSTDIELRFPSLDKIDEHKKNAEVILIVAAKLVHRIERSGRRFRGDFLNLLGLRYVSWDDNDEIDASHVLDVGNQFVRLICKHHDIVNAIIQRNTHTRPRKGPPCPYCGVKLWHPKGQQCLECGWDWHDAENPVQRKTGAGRKPPPPIACLQDGGNPFNERGWLRTVEQDADDQLPARSRSEVE